MSPCICYDAVSRRAVNPLDEIGSVDIDEIGSVYFAWVYHTDDIATPEFSIPADKCPTQSNVTGGSSVSDSAGTRRSAAGSAARLWVDPSE